MKPLALLAALLLLTGCESLRKDETTRFINGRVVKIVAPTTAEKEKMVRDAKKMRKDVGDVTFTIPAKK